MIFGLNLVDIWSIIGLLDICEAKGSAEGTGRLPLVNQPTNFDSSGHLVDIQLKLG